MVQINKDEVEKIRKAVLGRTVTLADGTRIPAIGQGTWHMGDDPSKRQAEVESLRLGVRLGMTLIDTAELYGYGKSENVVGEAIRGIRFFSSVKHCRATGVGRIWKKPVKIVSVVWTPIILICISCTGKVPYQSRKRLRACRH